MIAIISLPVWCLIGKFCSLSLGQYQAPDTRSESILCDTEIPERKYNKITRNIFKRIYDALKEDMCGCVMYEFFKKTRKKHTKFLGCRFFVMSSVSLGQYQAPDTRSESILCDTEIPERKYNKITRNIFKRIYDALKEDMCGCVMYEFFKKTRKKHTKFLGCRFFVMSSVSCSQ